MPLIRKVPLYRGDGPGFSDGATAERRTRLKQASRATSDREAEARCGSVVSMEMPS